MKNSLSVTAFVSLLIVMFGFSLGEAMGQEAPLIEAEMELIRVEGEGYVEVEISIATTEMGGRGIADAQIRLEEVIGSRAFR